MYTEIFFSGTFPGVMPFRTPRRRISPRTKRRVRAIKEFFKKTLGTSQTNSKTNSSIIISVSDLKSKIDIIEQQLDKVSKHCRDLSCLDNSIHRAASSNENNISNDKRSSSADSNTKSLRGVETRVIYKTPNKDYIKSDESEYNNKYTTNDPKTRPSKHILSRNYEVEEREPRKKRHTNSPEKRERTNNLSKVRQERHRMRRASSSVNIYYDTQKDNRNNPGYSGYHRSQMHEDPHHVEKATHGRRENPKNEYQDTRRSEHHKSRKKKQKLGELDEDFIADIIRRQYKPVKLFGRRLSDFSQFSAPVCRDQEFSPRTDVEDDVELCSCCFEGQRRVSHRYCVKHDLSDMRSICDARLYSSKRHRRYKQVYLNDYNDSAVYDVVPVKEKASPKSRRKFIEESMMPYDCYKEVPPSPRTHRPRLNLKAQYYDYDDNIAPKRRQRNSPARAKNHHVHEEVCEDCSVNSSQDIKRCDLLQRVPSKPNNLQDTSLQYSTACNDQTNLTNNDTLMTTGSSTNKADQALFEIKDILQSFLQEIKKETASSNHSQISNKPAKSPDLEDNQKNNTTQVPFNGQAFTTVSSMGQCTMPPPYMPPFTNPCCYPLLPMCPINCTPNGYVVPSPSYTCTNCANTSKDACLNNKSPSNHNQPQPFDETQELIREIYKVVAQSPKSPRYVNQVPAHVEKKILTSRSVGSSNASKRDVMVETPKMKCYSKSCEAIGSRLTTATAYSTTNPSYSDTVLEKLSLEISDSSSESELDKEFIEKGKKHKFSKMFRRIGLFKRKKRDVIEEVSESESTVEVDIKQKHRPPFQQNIVNYAVHGQEYFHPPPIPDPRFCHVHDMPHRHAYDDETHGPRTSPYDTCKHGPHLHDHSTPHHYHAPPRVTPPCCKYDYDPHYHNIPPPPQAHPQVHPQVPLCLKEIEVKSTGTQSDRKMSIFRKFKKKDPPPPTHQQVAMHVGQQAQKQHTFSTQTPKEKTPMFNWKSLQEKAKKAGSNSDPMKFSLKTQRQLAEGDMKLRNAMLKKLFYKRNPFSPRNLIVRTLLGKDKSSFGEPPKMYRPRMFI